MSRSVVCLFLSILLCAPLRPTFGEEEEGRIRVGTFRPADPPRAAPLREGRRLYETSRSLRFSQPYLCAANEAERKKGMAVKLTPRTAHRVFGPIRTPEAAAEVAMVFFDAVLVPDRVQYDRMVEAARECEARVSIAAGQPDFYGLQVEARPDGFRVRALLYDRSEGIGALRLLAVTTDIPTDDPIAQTIEVRIDGPVQSWQTMGEPGEADRRRRKAMIAFRNSMNETFPAERSLAAFENVSESGPTLNLLTESFGPPEKDIGSGIHIYEYRLDEGRLLVGTVAPEAIPLYIRYIAPDGTETPLYERTRRF